MTETFNSNTAILACDNDCFTRDKINLDLSLCELTNIYLEIDLLNYSSHFISKIGI